MCEEATPISTPRTKKREWIVPPHNKKNAKAHGKAIGANPEPLLRWFR